MTTLLLLLALAFTPFQEGQERKPIPKDSIEVVVLGCLSGRVLAVDDIRQTDIERGPTIRARSFRLAGKKDVMEIVKDEDHHVVEVTGLMKKADLTEPGMKVGKGVTLSGGPPVAGTPGGAPAPAVQFIPVLDVSNVRPRGDSCGSGWALRREVGAAR